MSQSDDDADDIDRVLGPLLAPEDHEASQPAEIADLPIKTEGHEELDEDELVDSELDKELDDEIGRLDDEVPAPHLPAPLMSAANAQPQEDGLVSDKNKSFLELLEEIPSDVISYFLRHSGVAEPSEQLQKIMAFAVQRFVGEIANDSLHYLKFRLHSTQTKEKSALRKPDPKLIFTMEDLSQSVREYGINLFKPEYWSDAVFETPAQKEKAKQEKAKTTNEKRKRKRPPPVEKSGSKSKSRKGKD